MSNSQCMKCNIIHIVELFTYYNTPSRENVINALYFILTHLKMIYTNTFKTKQFISMVNGRCTGYYMITKAIFLDMENAFKRDV